MPPEPLLERDLDLAIRFGPLEDSSLIAKELGQAQLVWSASPQYLDRRGTPTSIDELAEHDLLAFSSRPGNEQDWSWLRTGTGTPLIPRLSCSLEMVTFDVCRAGLGIAQLPYIVCQQALADGTLVEVLPEHRPPPGPFHAVYAGRIQGNPTLSAFLETVAARLRLKPWCPAK